MYTSFQIKNFRCFDELRMADLHRVNLIAGRNNVGKTALLEALFLHCGGSNPELTLRVNALRGIEQIKVEVGAGAVLPWHSFFPAFDVSKAIELVGEDSVTGLRTLRVRVLREPSELLRTSASLEENAIATAPVAVSSDQAVGVLELQDERPHETPHRYQMIMERRGLRTEPAPPPPPFPGFFLAATGRIPPEEVAARFGNLEKYRKQDLLLNVLKIIEPRLTRVAVIVAFGTPMLHGDVGLEQLLPLPFMGGGMVRLAWIVLTIANSPKGVVLVDEFENGFHHAVLPKVWRAVADAARSFDAQVFATTHSRECIIAAHEAFRDSREYDFGLHRLEASRDGTGIRAVTYSDQTLQAAIETDLEVR